MKPSYISTIVMSLILPARFTVGKMKPLTIINDQQELSYKSLFNRSSDGNRYRQSFPTTIMNAYKLYVRSDNGLESLEAVKDTAQTYEIYCCGNAEDAMSPSLVLQRIQQNPNTNYIFWNYPGVGGSKSKGDSVNSLFDACFSQAMKLIDKGIPANHITLYGYSLGGSVAVHAASKLHSAGHDVNLEIERSFADLATIIPEHIMQKIEQNNHSDYAPLITSIIALAVSGVALGTTFAGFIASIGYAVAITIGWSENETLLRIASFTECAVNLIGSIVGSGIAVLGLVSGALAGMFIGLLLSVQLLWTEEPLTMPMHHAFSAVLYSLCCTMNSADELKSMLTTSSVYSGANIKIHNTRDDKIIPYKAGLLTGLGLNEDQYPIEYKDYRYGGHAGHMSSRV